MELFLYDVIPERAKGQDDETAQGNKKKQQQSDGGGPNTVLTSKTAAVTKIRIADLLNGVKDMDDNPYFPAQDYPDMPLVALHNTDARKVRHMHELGGIALPSIAVTRADLPYTNFGDITLIGDAAFIDPEQKENAAYDADVYSPRYPEIYGYKVEKDAAERFAQMVELFLYDVIPERAKGEDNKKAQEDEKKQQQPSYGVNNTALELEAAVASKITIHDLLKGVKDMDGNPYLQAQDYPDMPLVALHNTDARKFRPHCTSRCLY